MDQTNIPILTMLEDFVTKSPLSFHVPGHKHGEILPKRATTYFEQILKIDVTELPGLDDLHAPEGAIREAEQLASDFFQSEHSFFLVNGSTVGNLAMILATCQPDDKVIVQRNSHKSIMNGLELAQAKPIFLAPEYDDEVKRFTSLSLATVEKALEEHTDAKALILTYPDYFGRVYDVQTIIQRAHEKNIPVLVDEAHGVHFALGHPFPPSALTLGADVVVQSAHKTAPAMTMASYLHFNSQLVSKEKLAYLLQMLQSSSPSYPLMASLDTARAYLASLSSKQIEKILEDVEEMKNLFQTASKKWKVMSSDDPLKITIQLEDGYSAKAAAHAFEVAGIYPELTTDRQILFILGLQPFTEWNRLKKVLKTVDETLKNNGNHATIEVVNFFTDDTQQLALSYWEMEQLETRLISLHDAVGEVAAEPVIPYPPGIPFILKGEKVTPAHIQALTDWIASGVRIQQRHEGIRVFIRN